MKMFESARLWLGTVTVGFTPKLMFYKNSISVVLSLKYIFPIFFFSGIFVLLLK